MAFRPFVKIRLDAGASVEARHVNLVQDNIGASLSQLLGKDSLDRTLLTGVALQPSGVNYVKHKLGRPVTGFSVVRRDTDLRVWDASGTNVSPHLLLPVMSSATGTVSLEVF